MKKYKLWNYFLDKPIKSKLNIFFTLLIVVPLLLFGGIVFYLVGRIQMEDIYISSQQYVAQSMQGINMTLSELDNIIASNLWNQDLLNILNQDSLTAEHDQEDRDQVENLLRSIANARKDIDCLSIVTKYGETYIYAPSDAYSEFQEYIRKDEAEDGIQTNEKYLRGETIWKGDPEKRNYVIGVREIKDFESLENLGRLYVFIKEETIRQQYESLKTTSGSFFIVWDGDEQIISCDNEEITDIERKDVSISQGIYMNLERVNGKLYYYEGLKDETIGWVIQEYTPRIEVMRNIYRVQLMLFSVILVMLGILILLMNWFSNYLTEPIRNLQTKMQEVKKENFDVIVEEERKDELGELGQTFNEMTARIKTLIEEDYQSKILLRETEYKFLRAQINPHFLYNTLDAISWMASMGGNKDVSKMSVALGKILRWSISNTDNIVFLREEVDNVEDYLSIQRIRYGENLQYVIAIESPEKEMLVPKMILQPLVENALIHGLEPKDGMKSLILTAVSDEETLTIILKDNGVGMTEEKIRYVLSGGGKSKENSEKQHGVGIYNVHKRIQMNFGDQYGLRIISKPGEGTEIQIIVPKTCLKHTQEYEGGRK